RAEQRADDRDLADPRHLALQLAIGRLQEPGDSETLPVAKFNDRVSPPGYESGDRYAAQIARRGCAYRSGRIKLAHFGLQRHMDQAVLQHDRRESQFDAKLLVFNSDLA